ncbi:homeobox protein VENTX [Bombina bombina]|uniref:homeobox protein VENTX n=1 Tax=Bombina bombina TaxID=8345 RepID=UPI00235AB78B|nr:homeobox protein VENTX [Bombina bombina]
MEKKSFTVEWLSESSQKTNVPSNVNLCNYMYGHPTMALGTDYRNLSSSAKEFRNTNYSEKENYVATSLVKENRVSAFPTQRNIQPNIEGTCIPRKGVNEVFGPRQNQVQQEECNSDSDSLKSPGSVFEEEEEQGARARTKFTVEQLNELEKSFKEHRYIGSSEKKRLSKVLKLSEIQIKTWFQNRRMKFKRQSQDAKVEAFFSRLYVPYYGYTDFQGQHSSMRPECAIPVPPYVPALPSYSVQPAMVGPAQYPQSIAVSSLASYPSSSMLLHPMRNESTGQRFRPY